MFFLSVSLLMMPFFPIFKHTCLWFHQVVCISLSNSLSLSLLVCIYTGSGSTPVPDHHVSTWLKVMYLKIFPTNPFLLLMCTQIWTSLTIPDTEYVLVSVLDTLDMFSGLWYHQECYLGKKNLSCCSFFCIAISFDNSIILLWFNYGEIKCQQKNILLAFISQSTY